MSGVFIIYLHTLFMQASGSRGSDFWAWGFEISGSLAGDNGRVYRGECLGNPDIA